MSLTKEEIEKMQSTQLNLKYSTILDRIDDLNKLKEEIEAKATEKKVSLQRLSKNELREIRRG